MNRTPTTDHRSPSARHVDPGDARFTALMFSAAAAAFILGGLITISAGPPPSEAPVLGMLSHALWALAAALLAIGAVTIVRSTEALRRRRSGALALGALGLGTVVGLQWVTWAYVDLRASLHVDYDLALATVITPFGAGHVLMYAILVGSGLAFLGRALAKAGASSPFIGVAGIVIGSLTAVAAVIPLFLGLGGGSDGHVLFDVATLLIPVCFLWAAIAGIHLARRA